MKSKNLFGGFKTTTENFIFCARFENFFCLNGTDVCNWVEVSDLAKVVVFYYPKIMVGQKLSDSTASTGYNVQ
jgi:Na+/melibiose symporter-like transporter